MKNFNRALAAAFLFACLTLPGTSWADAPAASRLALEAKEALDAHYGNPAQLTLAAELLTRALAENKDDATVYVQAARLTVKGGHVVSSRFRPGTLDAYGELLDRALALDPGNSKAHILKAEYFHLRRDYDSERAELDKARELGTSDPWLLVGYGRLHEALGDDSKARAYYSEVRSRGPGGRPEQRNAYIGALDRLARFAASTGDENALRDLTAAIRRDRDARDAWSLGNLADSLICAGMFDEAMAASRDALRVMNYGAGRLTLAAALFGKAAELTRSGRHGEAAPLLKEARDYGYSKTSVLGRFGFAAAKVNRLLPTIESLIE